MKPSLRIVPALAFAAVGLAGCSVRVDRAAFENRYQLEISEGRLYRIDTKTGAVWVREGDDWQQIAAPVTSVSRKSKSGDRDHDDDDWN